MKEEEESKLLQSLDGQPPKPWTPRVLHLDSERTWRGGENQMFLLARGLAVPHIEHPPIQPRFLIRTNSMAAERLPALFSRETSSANQADLHIHQAPYRGSVDPWTVRQVIQLCDQYGIDIIHSQTAISHSIALLAAVWRPRLKVVVHRRVDYIPDMHAWNRWKYLNARISGYVAISEKIYGILKNLGIDESRIRLIHSAIDPRPYQDEHRMSQAEKILRLSAWGARTDGVPTIVQAAAFTQQKGYPTLIEGLHRLQQLGRDFQALIAGDGPLLAASREKVRQFGLEAKVHFLGYIDNVPELLQCGEILCMPSEDEGLGTMILEALSAGCAVCATAVGGIPEMIKHGTNGLLSPPGDAHALALHLEQLIAQPKLRDQFRQQSKATLERFSLEQMVEKNRQHYLDILS